MEGGRSRPPALRIRVAAFIPISFPVANRAEAPYYLCGRGILWCTPAKRNGMMTIQLNGAPREVPEGLTLAALLKWLGLDPDRVAVERNMQIVKRSEWGDTPIEGGDRLEVVQMVGGGSGRRKLP